MRFHVAYYFFDLLIDAIQRKTVEVAHEDILLKLLVPNGINRYRANTFSSKEPETLNWINGFEEGATFWDIGANVGLYSCYAGMKKKAVVTAIEPSFFNLELLAKNIYINNLSDQIRILPLAISEKSGFQDFYLSTIVRGGALSTFGERFGHNGLPLDFVFRYSTYGVSLDYVVSQMGLEPPAYLKIDVDGLEHLILRGALNVIPQIKSILIEINEGFGEQFHSVSNALTENGFILTAKLHSDIVENSENFSMVFNQIWENKKFK